VGDKVLQEPSLENYNGQHKVNFVSFAKACGITPDIDRMYAFHRLGSPIGFHPANDTQFYLYFPEEVNPRSVGHSNLLKLNESEFTEHRWLTPELALDLYSRHELALFPPQVFLLSYLSFLTP
jgi:hypothetical protein